MNRTTLLFACTLILSGCTGIRNYISPPGEMKSNGKISECHGFMTDSKACGESKYNALRVQQLSLGQTVEQARQIMGRDPEERSLKKQEDRNIEVWNFLIDYDKSIVSVITFTDGKISAIEQLRR